MAPKPAETVYKHIEFVRLSGMRALAVFVSGSGIVHNRIITLDEEITHKDLERVSGFLNREMAGKTLREIRARLVAMMEEEKNRYTRFLANLMHTWQTPVQEEAGESEGELFVGGLSEFFNIPDFRDMERMKELFRAFEEKHRLVKLLDRAIEADGVQVYIGSETPYFEMEGVSLVVASYKAEGNVVGTLGVIGPSRMPYNTVIPLVDRTAKVLSRMMGER